MSISATKLINGAWEVSAIIGNYRESRVFYGFSKRDAIAAFRREFRA